MYLTKKIHFILMRKNSYDKILKGKFKEQYLNIVPKSCSSIKHIHINIYI